MSIESEIEKLDLFNLDEQNLWRAWTEHPKLVWRFNLKKAKIIRDLNAARAEKELIHAELDRAVRQDPQLFKLTDKITEPAIKAAIHGSKAYIKIADKIADLEHEADVIGALTTTLYERRKTLEAMLSMIAMEFKAQPRVPEEAKERIDELRKAGAYGGSRKRK